MIAALQQPVIAPYFVGWFVLTAGLIGIVALLSVTADVDHPGRVTAITVAVTVFVTSFVFFVAYNLAWVDFHRSVAR